MKGTRVYFSVILSFGALFGRFKSLQCNTMVFRGALEHDKSVLEVGIREKFDGQVKGRDFTLDW